MSTASGAETRVERVYVWEMPIRLTHWILVFAIITLCATGYYIGIPSLRFRAPPGIIS
jgi:Ni,Fe-hydrogenase I cytochrome b subunit